MKFNEAEKTAIKTLEEGDSKENPWVKGKPAKVDIAVVSYDPKWVQVFQQLKSDIQITLVEKAVTIAYVGSTAIKGLAAKPIIDIDLIVENPADEASYISALEILGYELIIRESSWYQHRMLKLYYPQVNLHIFAPQLPRILAAFAFQKVAPNRS